MATGIARVFDCHRDIPKDSLDLKKRRTPFRGKNIRSDPVNKGISSWTLNAVPLIGPLSFVNDMQAALKRERAG
jgi:hypothetical protein